jgi:hypothetical protein
MEIISLILLIVVVIASITIKRDTSDLICRSDKIQKELDKILKKERRNDVKPN